MSFMNKISASNNIDNDEFTLNKEESEYHVLIIRLKEISRTISLLEKKYLD